MIRGLLHETETMYVNTPAEKTKVHIPVTLRCRVTVDRGMFYRQYRGCKINDMEQLWPYSHLRSAAMDGAKEWIRQMKLQDYELLTPESDILVMGPYKSRNWSGAGSASWRPAPGAAPSFRAFSEMANEDPQAESADFILEARFLAGRLRMVEHSITTPTEGMPV